MKAYRSLKITVWSTLLLALLGCAEPGLAQTCSKCANAPAGITNWWPGDFNAQDLLTTNAGTATNVTYTAGQVQNAFTLAGNGDIQFGPNIANFGTSDFGVAFWIKSTTIGGQAVMENRVSCENGQFWSIRSGGQITVEIDDGSTDFAVMGSVNVADGNYHHVAVVRRGRALSIYVDGQLDATATGTKKINVGSPAVFQAGSSVCSGLDGTVNLNGPIG
ncbi:MAG: LamG domain-containing protein [Bryobacteraceae bacterium]